MAEIIPTIDFDLSLSAKVPKDGRGRPRKEMTTPTTSADKKLAYTRSYHIKKYSDNPAHREAKKEAVLRRYYEKNGRDYDEVKAEKEGRKQLIDALNAQIAVVVTQLEELAPVVEQYNALVDEYSRLKKLAARQPPAALAPATNA